MKTDALLAGLATAWLGKTVFYKEETASTNQDAKEALAAPNGAVFTCNVQTGGRGRLGRQWNMADGEGIAMSLLLKLEALPKDIAQVTLLAGLAVLEAVCALYPVKAQLKWPNDIVVVSEDGRLKKLCGILTELVSGSGQSSVIVGIGVNVNQRKIAPNLRQKATSLALESGAVLPRQKLMCAILERFEAEYEQFLSCGMTDDMLARYSRHCCNIGRRCSFVQGKTPCSGIATGLLPTGELQIQTDTGVVAVSSGEVTMEELYKG